MSGASSGYASSAAMTRHRSVALLDCNSLLHEVSKSILRRGHPAAGRLCAASGKVERVHEAHPDDTNCNNREGPELRENKLLQVGSVRHVAR